jgi:hypothetical protein
VTLTILNLSDTSLEVIEGQVADLGLETFEIHPEPGVEVGTDEGTGLAGDEMGLEDERSSEWMRMRMRTGQVIVCCRGTDTRVGGTT